MTGKGTNEEKETRTLGFAALGTISEGRPHISEGEWFSVIIPTV